MATIIRIRRMANNTEKRNAMEEKKPLNPETVNEQDTENTEPSETWAHETIQELLDFWEEQGVYIRE